MHTPSICNIGGINNVLYVGSPRIIYATVCHCYYIHKMKLDQLILLMGAYCCALGYVRIGLICFVLGGLPSVYKRDTFSIMFMGSSVIGLLRVI